MFGIVRPCRHRLCTKLHQAWMGHLCGLCLTLRDEHGHASRVVTNYDGLLVSVLVQAQAPERSPLRRAAPCLLRGLARADVVDARSEGARLSAAVSLVLAAGKARDHVADRDGLLRHRLAASTAERVADRWENAGARTAAAIGFDVGVLTSAVDQQVKLEAASAQAGPRGPHLLDLTRPAEAAVAAAFQYTATLADTPQNTTVLAEAGAHFGRLAHILDAVEDLEEDRALGAYNPLIATATSRAEARRHCDDALMGLELAVQDLALRDDRLVRALLVREVRHAIHRAFADHRPVASRAQLAALPHGVCLAPPADPAQFSPGEPTESDEAGKGKSKGGCCSNCDCCECCVVCECCTACDC